MQKLEEITEEQKKYAIDLLVTLTVGEIAKETKITPAKVLYDFIASETGKLLYDETSKLWWNGPSYIAKMYMDEQKDFEFETEKTMYSYDINYYIDILRDYSSLAPRSIDDKSKEKIKELYAILDAIQPFKDNSERKAIWIRALNGSLKDFTPKYIDRNYYEEDDDIDPKEAKKEWENCAKEEYEEEYHGKYSWYKLETIYHTDRYEEPFYGVIVNHEYVLSIGDPNQKGEYDIDASEFIEELIKLTKEALQLLKNGQYEEYIREIPYEDRYGTIGRKDYWNIFQEQREVFRAGLTEEEIADFVQTAECAPNNLKSTMTARNFFEACMIGYKAAGYEPRDYNLYNDTEEEHDRYGETTPKEMYSWYADGRDDGLCNVPLDDALEFEKWMSQDGDYYVFNGHHPYEIVSSGSLINSIHLYPRKTKDGWELILSSTRAGRSTEIAKMFLAMRNQNIPVVLDSASELVARYTETDIIGILPKTIGAVGSYAHHLFPQKVSDVIELPSKKDDKYDILCQKADWIPEMIPELTSTKNSEEN